jgi:hypothetical protein
VEQWAIRWPDRVLAFDTNQARRFAPATDRWLTALREGIHTHDGDPLTDLHVKATHLRKVRIGDEETDGRTKYVLIKGDDGGRIDAAVADVLAYEAAMTMPEDPPIEDVGFVPFSPVPPGDDGDIAARLAALGKRELHPDDQRLIDQFFGDDDE